MNWINAKEKLPDEQSERVIYAARWIGDREPLDVVAYEELCVLGDGKVRIGRDVYKKGQEILANVDWLDD